MSDEKSEKKKVHELHKKDLREWGPAYAHVVTPPQRRILHEIRVSGATIPLDLSLRLKEDVEDVENVLSEMADKELVKTSEGYFHLTYKGLKTLRQFEEE